MGHTACLLFPVRKTDPRAIAQVFILVFVPDYKMKLSNITTGAHKILITYFFSVSKNKVLKVLL